MDVEVLAGERMCPWNAEADCSPFKNVIHISKKYHKCSQTLGPKWRRNGSVFYWMVFCCFSSSLNGVLFDSSWNQPFLESRLKLQDTCGIHNLHAVPGMLGGFVGAIVAASATEAVYSRLGWVITTYAQLHIFNMYRICRPHILFTQPVYLSNYRPLSDRFS